MSTEKTSAELKSSDYPMDSGWYQKESGDTKENQVVPKRIIKEVMVRSDNFIL